MPTFTPPMWTFEEAAKLIRAVQPFAAHAGYHLGLAGGVLNRGTSFNDVDIIVMPLADDPHARSLSGLWRAFEFAGNVKDINEITIGYPQERGRSIYRAYNGVKKIDLFVYEKLPLVERIKRFWRRGLARFRQPATAHDSVREC